MKSKIINAPHACGDSSESVTGDSGAASMKRGHGVHREVMVSAAMLALSFPLPAFAQNAPDKPPQRVPNVAPGVDPTDAVNKSQLDVVASTAMLTNRYFQVNGAKDGTDSANALGDGSLAAGVKSRAWGLESMALGWTNIATGQSSNAVGFNNWTRGNGSNAFGRGNVVEALGVNGNAFGTNNFVEGEEATVLGNDSNAHAKNSLVLGNRAAASAEDSVAIGTGSIADVANTVSVGREAQQRRCVQLADGVDPHDAVNKSQLDIVANAATATNRYFKANGANDDTDSADASGKESVAVGVKSKAKGNESMAIGSANAASGKYANAVGYMNTASGDNSSAVGSHNLTDAGGSSAFGRDNSVSGIDGNAFGANNYVDGDEATVLGNDSTASANNSLVLGNKATASAEGSVAIGAGSVANIENTVSVGSDTQQRRIVHVAAGTDDTDAVNLSQLSSMAAGSRVQLDAIALALGGGAKESLAGVFSPPSYLVQGTQYQNVGAALNALDGAISGAWTNMRTLQNPPPGMRNFDPFVAIDGKGDGSDTASVKPASGGVAVGAGAKVGDSHGTAVGQGASVSASEAVALGHGAVADRANTVSVGNARQQRQITNVAAGVQDTDAANTAQVQAALQTAKTYADAGDRSTLNQSMAYTDKKTADFVSRGELGSLRSEVNDQFGKVNTRIDRMGAMGAASTQMAINAAGASGNGRLAAGVGLQGGRSAISVGYAAPLGTKMRASVGVTASGSQTSAGVGFGVDL